jgi:putative flippase GtrA
MPDDFIYSGCGKAALNQSLPKMQTQSETTVRLPLSTQLVRFGIIGGCTVAFDFGLLYVLVHSARLNYFISAFIAFVTASTLNYALSVQYVFMGGRFDKGPEFMIFMVTTVVGLGLNQLTWLLVAIAGVNYLLAKCASLAIVTGWNFLAKKRIVFLD